VRESSDEIYFSIGHGNRLWVEINSYKLPIGRVRRKGREYVVELDDFFEKLRKGGAYELRAGEYNLQRLEEAGVVERDGSGKLRKGDAFDRIIKRLERGVFLEVYENGKWECRRVYLIK